LTSVLAEGPMQLLWPLRTRRHCLH